MWKIELENSMFNWYQLEQFKNLSFLIGNLAILEIQDRFIFFNRFLQKCFTVKIFWKPGYAGQKICVSVYGIRRVFRMRISRIPIFWNTVRPHNIIKVWTQLKNGVYPNICATFSRIFCIFFCLSKSQICKL